MPLYGICLINHSIKDEYTLRSFTAARHKSNTTTHLVLFRKGTVLYYYQAKKLGFILSIISKSLGKLTKYCLYFLEMGQERNMSKQYASH